MSDCLLLFFCEYQKIIMVPGPLKHRLVFQCVVHMDGKKASRCNTVADPQQLCVRAEEKSS